MIFSLKSNFWAINFFFFFLTKKKNFYFWRNIWVSNLKTKVSHQQKLSKYRKMCDILGIIKLRARTPAPQFVRFAFFMRNEAPTHCHGTWARDTLIDIILSHLSLITIFSTYNSAKRKLSTLSKFPQGHRFFWERQ